VKKLFFPLFLLLFLARLLPAQQVVPAQQVPAQEDYQIEHALVGAYAVNMRTGKVLIDQNSEMSLMPGSCLKLVTTAAALELLGPKMRFETKLEYDGKVSGGVLEGNLYVRGGGDPCLGSDRFTPWQKQLELWVEALGALGIQTIRGKVLADASHWEKVLAVPSWLWEDLGNYYGAGASALSFHENFYSLVFKPGAKIGERASILRLDPAISDFTLHSEVTTGPEGSGDRACIYGSEYSPLGFVYGTIPAGVESFAIKGAILDPPAFCAAAFTKALRAKGMVVEEKNLPLSKSRTSFHTTSSPSVAEIVYWTNQKSLNLYAEHLLKKMGETLYGEGSTEYGLRAVSSFLRAQKIDLAGWQIADGSGLSRKNLVTAKQLVSLLIKLQSSSHFSLLLQSLPKQGKHLKAKSGSFSSMKVSYAGYAGDIAFAIVVNHCTDKQKVAEKTALFLSNLDHLVEKSHDAIVNP